MRKLLLPLAAASVLLFSGCASFDVEEAENQMEDAWDKALGASGTEIECPDSIDLKNGTKATCNVTLQGGEKRTVDLEITDEENGTFVYDLPQGG